SSSSLLKLIGVSESFGRSFGLTESLQQTINLKFFFLKQKPLPPGVPQNSDDIHPSTVQAEVPKDKPADEPVVVIKPKTQSEEDEPPKVELKELPPHLEYAFLGNNGECIDVIDEMLKEDFDDLLDEGSEILHSIERNHPRRIFFLLNSIHSWQ
nr:hypothetical protein [Tanacetum cinerariifolium]